MKWSLQVLNQIKKNCFYIQGLFKYLGNFNSNIKQYIKLKLLNKF